MEQFLENYNYVMSKADPRTTNWFLVSSPIPTIVVVLLYLVVIYGGQAWMKHRPAFDLKNVIVVYNFFLVVLSVYMVYEFVMSSFLAPNINFACESMDYSDNKYAVRLASVCWWYFFSKIIELMDTVFFMLRKKNNQISFLHVYHHSTMPLLWWIGIKFVAGGEAYFSPTLNSIVHVFMYSYYLLSAMGPAMQPYLWWKKYMTTLQLVQFWAIVGKTCYSLHVGCDYPVEFGYALITYCFSHIVLFSNFYYQTYTKQAKLRQLKKSDGDRANGDRAANGHGKTLAGGDMASKTKTQAKNGSTASVLSNGNRRVSTRKIHKRLD